MKRITAFLFGLLLIMGLAPSSRASWTAMTDDPVRDNSYIGLAAIDDDSVAVIGVVNSAFLTKRSDDDGETWQDIVWSTELMLPMLITLHFHDSDHGWMGGLGAIHYTTDGINFSEVVVPGEYWGPIPLSTIAHIGSYSTREALAVGDRGSMSGASKALILQTADGGESWTEAVGDITMKINALEIVDETHTWMIGGVGVDTNGDDKTDRYENGTVFFSTDKGSTWTTLLSGQPYGLLGVSFLDADKGWMVGSDGSRPVLFITEDGGATWRRPDPADLGIPATADSYSYVKVLSPCEIWIMGSVPVTGAVDDLFVHSLDGGSTFVEEFDYAGDAFMLFYDFLDRETGWAAGSYKTVVRYDSETADPGTHCDFPDGDPIASPEEEAGVEEAPEEAEALEETTETVGEETVGEEAVEPPPEAADATHEDAAAEPPDGEEKRGCGCALAS